MYTDAPQFLEALGGYRAVAKRLEIAPTTLHTHMTRGVLPPKYYTALCELAFEKEIDQPARSLFDFVTLPALAAAPVSDAEKDAAA